MKKSLKKRCIICGLNSTVGPEEWGKLDRQTDRQTNRPTDRLLVKKILVSKDEKEFKEALYDLWFKLYSRTRGIGVS